MSFSINTFKVDSWNVSFSNIPTIDKPEDLAVLERFVKGCNLPEYDLPFDHSVFQGYAIQHPLAHDVNRNLTLLQLEFKLSEDLKNYLYLYVWMQNLKYGLNVDTELARKYWCNEIRITMLDNLKRNTGWFKFTHAFCTSLSALPLSSGTGEEITFIANFSYEQYLFEGADIPECKV